MSVTKATAAGAATLTTSGLLISQWADKWQATIGIATGFTTLLIYAFFKYREHLLLKRQTEELERQRVVVVANKKKKKS